MGQVLKWMVDHWTFCGFVLAIFIQITPAIKWNPLSAFARWIGKQITNDVSRQIADIKERVQAIEERQMRDEKDRIRFEVLDFANSCRNNKLHTKDEFLHIIELNDKYEKLLAATNDTNGVFTAEFGYIMKLYQKCQENNSFLT